MLHPTVNRSIRLMRATFQSSNTTGDLEGAEALLLEAHQGLTAAAGFGASHPRALTCLHNLAQLAWAQGAREKESQRRDVPTTCM